MGTKTQKLSNVVDQIVEWQSVFTGDGSTGLTAVAGRGYFIDTTSGTVTVTLPTDANSKLGDTIVIRDYAGTFATNNVTITSTAKISEADADGTLSTNDLVMTLTYVNSTKGWVTMENEAKSAGAVDTSYISATGGTVTTSGDYKIHTFTGDGCFVVSSLGVGIPCAQATSVDYLVVAGGAGGGTGVLSGGAGAGGFRYSSSSYTSPPCAPGHPLRSTCGLTISATTYPITVGGGGAIGPNCTTPGVQGSNSVFSTITSAGGGGGGSRNANPSKGGNGGSGGGAGDNANPPTVGGTGNTPPTSPPQGNNGGDVSSAVGAGGGGAIGVGTPGPSPYHGGPGGAGAGLPNAFGTSGENCGSFYYFSGGGGGGTSSTNPAGQPNGGIGGGGNGGIYQTATAGCAGSANTGGGGGAGGGCGSVAGAGGKGIVIIRYKYQ